jgi:3-hydroxyisobutyryl-CoA hydrolase
MFLRQGAAHAVKLRNLRGMSHSHHHHESPLLSEVHGNVALVTLNRPKALNALNLDMVRLFAKLIPTWERSAAVVLKGTGGKAFCAGGDVKKIAEGKENGYQETFLREEYAVDNALAVQSRSVPHVVLADGVIMGGGVGISVNASFRIATEKSMFAMPETAIGFFPDVGGSYFLPRLPAPFGAPFGMYLGLTGLRLTGADLVHAGVATHFVSSAKLQEVEAELLKLPAWRNAEDAHGEVSRSLAKVGVLPRGDAHLPSCSLSGADLEAIADAFSAPTVEDIIAKAQAKAGNSALMGKVASALARMSPTSLKVTHEQLRRGASLSLADCYRMELRMAMATLQDSDFYEGVRAVLVDKDNKPKWNPPTLDAVSQAKVQSHFASLGARELQL